MALAIALALALSLALALALKLAIALSLALALDHGIVVEVNSPQSRTVTACVKTESLGTNR